LPAVVVRAKGGLRPFSGLGPAGPEAARRSRSLRIMELARAAKAALAPPTEPLLPLPVGAGREKSGAAAASSDRISNGLRMTSVSRRRTDDSRGLSPAFPAPPAVAEEVNGPAAGHVGPEEVEEFPPSVCGMRWGAMDHAT
jgi:hypothetical protein